MRCVGDHNSSIHLLRYSRLLCYPHTKLGAFGVRAPRYSDVGESLLNSKHRRSQRGCRLRVLITESEQNLDGALQKPFYICNRHHRSCHLPADCNQDKVNPPSTRSAYCMHTFASSNVALIYSWQEILCRSIFFPPASCPCLCLC